jgi:PPK2 family polyphosphate:nucleotide phosphotransferase
MNRMASGARWSVRAGHAVDLRGIDPASTAGAPGDRVTTDAALDVLHEQLFALQDRLRADEDQRSLLVVLQGLDTSGKDGTIRHVFRGVNPQATRVTAFKEPTPEEQAHDFLWRIHRAVPAAGEIGIFNRSHYEDVLVARVHRLVPEPVWRARYDAINDFERQLATAGTTIVKTWLHISPNEQRRRLLDRLARPDKRWKYQAGDLAERARWHDYQKAAEDMLRHTSTADAPWYVVPADHKWYRNWVVSTILIDTLNVMNPRYPELEDLGDIEIPDVP